MVAKACRALHEYVFLSVRAYRFLHIWGRCAVHFRVGSGQRSSGRGHVFFLFYDRAFRLPTASFYVFRGFYGLYATA